MKVSDHIDRAIDALIGKGFTPAIIQLHPTLASLFADEQLLTQEGLKARGYRDCKVFRHEEGDNIVSGRRLGGPGNETLVEIEQIIVA